MTEEIRRGTIQALQRQTGLPIYGQEIPQGGKRPCVTVEVLRESQHPRLGRRAEREVTLLICYEGEGSAAEKTGMAEHFSEALRLIGEKERFFCREMTWERTDKGLRLTASYPYLVELEAEEIGKMERLQQNGKGVVGYGRGSKIQQGAAEQK